MKRFRFAILVDEQGVPDWAKPLYERFEADERIETLAILTRASKPGLEYELKTVREAGSLFGGLTLQQAGLKARINGLKLDFILSLTGEEDVSLPFSSHFGIWRFRFGEHLDGLDMGIDEILDGADVQNVFLERVAEDQKVRTLKQGCVKLNSHSLEHHRKAVVAQIWNWPFSMASAPSIESAASLTTTTAKSVGPLRYARARIRMACARIAHELARLHRQFYRIEWSIGSSSFSRGHVVSNAEAGPIEWWKPQRGSTSWADPFPIEVNGQKYVFVEEFTTQNERGSIVALTMDGAGAGERRPAISFPRHLSYPCVFKDGDATYAVFEDLYSRALTIHRCVKFPDTWLPWSVVNADAQWADPTILRHDEKWWVFATSYDKYSHGNASLSIFYSENGLRGPWLPHAMNPVKVDIHSSRSAGSFFEVDGVLYRPSQNCSKRYGGSIWINRIDRLTPNEFSETSVSEILPAADRPMGLHHMTASADVTIFDGSRARLNLTAGFVRIWRLVRNRELALAEESLDGYRTQASQRKLRDRSEASASILRE